MVTFVTGVRNMNDLKLEHLGQFCGTLDYYSVLGARVTDGVMYIMENGYSWFVTDALAVIMCDPKLNAEPFLAVKLKVNLENSKADVTITDGNDREFYQQHYEYTDAKRDLTLFFENGVLLLASEH
jgi:hypothetical protein